MDRIYIAVISRDSKNLKELQVSAGDVIEVYKPVASWKSVNNTLIFLTDFVGLYAYSWGLDGTDCTH